MKKDYIITQEDLANKGLILSEYALDGSMIAPIIEIALGLAVSSILDRNDDLKGEQAIESELDNNAYLVSGFKKLQYQIIYNLIFLGDTDPINSIVERIIRADLRMCKLNGFQTALNRGIR
jgi:hypothetical protein